MDIGRSQGRLFKVSEERWVGGIMNYCVCISITFYGRVKIENERGKGRFFG